MFQLRITCWTSFASNHITQNNSSCSDHCRQKIFTKWNKKYSQHWLRPGRRRRMGGSGGQSQQIEKISGSGRYQTVMCLSAFYVIRCESELFCKLNLTLLKFLQSNSLNHFPSALSLIILTPARLCLPGHHL